MYRKSLEKKGIERIPSYAILRELSSWNVYIDTNGKKGIKPIMLCDFYREKRKKDFEYWVEKRYLPVFNNRQHKTVATEKEAHGNKALEKAAQLNYIDVNDTYESIDDSLSAQQDEHQ